MIILGIDTALGACSAAVLDGDRVLARQHEPMQRGHAELLAPMVERVMRDADIPFAALQRLAVTLGPGTFTGQRVGLAFVRALALALKLPAAGVTTLDAMAEEALAHSQEGKGTRVAATSMLATTDWAIACVDAKRGEVYLGARARGRNLLPPILLSLPAAQMRLATLAAQMGTDPILAGNGAALLESAYTVSEVTQPDAIFVARLGAAEPAPTTRPRPLYLREPDAKLPGAA